MLREGCFDLVFEELVCGGINERSTVRDVSKGKEAGIVVLIKSLSLPGSTVQVELVLSLDQ